MILTDVLVTIIQYCSDYEVWFLLLIFKIFLCHNFLVKKKLVIWGRTKDLLMWISPLLVGEAGQALHRNMISVSCILLNCVYVSSPWHPRHKADVLGMLQSWIYPIFIRISFLPDLYLCLTSSISFLNERKVYISQYILKNDFSIHPLFLQILSSHWHRNILFP